MQEKMIAYIKGNLEIKTKQYIVIEVAGIGYKIFMSESAIQKVGEIGQTVKIHTYMKVREDDVSLYGFITNEELRMFELLLGVSGIGAKSALTILSNVTPSSFALAVITSDVNILKKLSGIGPKTAQRVILELKDKLKKEQELIGKDKKEQTTFEQGMADDEKIAEAISALQVLGYTRKEIADALANVNMASLTLEEIIKQGLGNLAKSL